MIFLLLLFGFTSSEENVTRGFATKIPGNAVLTSEIETNKSLWVDLASIRPGVQRVSQSILENPILNEIENEIPCGIRNGYEYNRIVGGSPADKGEFPWQVSIQVSVGDQIKHSCGAAIVTSKFVITAAHCVSKIPKTRLRIVAGDYKLFEIDGTEQYRTVKQVFIDSFVIKSFSHDLALVEVNTPFTLKPESVAPICIPGSDAEFTGKGIVSGWGRLAEEGLVSNVLRKVEMPLVDPSMCKKLYERNGLGHYFNGCQYCAGLRKGGKDSCQGDSGGPLVCKDEVEGRYYLCGVVSWGIGCGRPSYPGIYTKVPCYSSWISRVVNNVDNITDTYT